MSFEWPTVRPRALGSQVTAHFERLIASGELKAGDKLPPERQIAEALDVSRTTVRDGLYELALKGVIDRRPGRGAVIQEPSSNSTNMLGIFDESARQLLEVVDLREAFEPAVAGRAAERATPADLARLTEILAASHPDLSPEESASLDREFHLQIAVASQNSLLVSLANVTADWLQDVRTESHQTRTGRAESCAGHREILDAISKRDADRAHLAMAEHVLGIGRLVKDRRSGTGKP